MKKHFVNKITSPRVDDEKEASTGKLSVMEQAQPEIRRSMMCLSPKTKIQFNIQADDEQTARELNSHYDHFNKPETPIHKMSKIDIYPDG